MNKLDNLKAKAKEKLNVDELKIDEKMQFVKAQAEKVTNNVAKEYRDKKSIFDKFDDENKFLISFLAGIAVLLFLSLLLLAIAII